MKSLTCMLGVSFFLIQTASAAVEPTGRYKATIEKLNELHAKYPKITSVYSVGTNDDDVPVMAMRVSLTPDNLDPKKIGQLVVATHHGNELKAVDFTLAFTEKLLARYQNEELFRANLADMEWTIVPVLNISGYNSNNRYEHGVDPNRDYPGPCIKAAGGKLKSIRVAQDLLKKRLYAGSLTVHGYLGALTYPWGVDTTNTHTHDHNQFEQITEKAAGLNGYRYGTSTDIVYPCDGSFEDYAYWKHGTWSLLLELKSGSPTDIQDTVTATNYFFDQLDSSPSVKNQLTGECHRSGRLDLHNE